MTALPGKGSVALVAHRGYAARYPENTLAALTAAVDAGADLLEFDIQLSRDHVPFLLHDAGFKRTGGVDKDIFELNAAEAAAISVGEAQRFGDRFAGVRAPRLADVVSQLTRWPGVTAFVEIKSESIGKFGHAVVLDAVLPVLQSALGQCVVISFDAEIIGEARARTGCRIGWAIRTWNDESQQLATQLAPDYLFCNEMKMPAVLWAGPWTWVAYEITEPKLARELVTRGVGMIETMWFTEMHAGLNNQAAE